MTVKPEHLASQFKDAILPPVLATPIMVLIMENAALNTIRDYLEADEAAVGTEINVKHLAATPVGHRVVAEAEVIEVDGRRIEFKVTACDETERIGAGTHQRMVVNLRRLKSRLAAKSRKMTGPSDAPNLPKPQMR
jgi:fluoroacetyl-CoA thioesterase